MSALCRSYKSERKNDSFIYPQSNNRRIPNLISDIQLNVYGSASAEASENVVITRVAYDSDNNADSSNSTINYTNFTI